MEKRSVLFIGRFQPFHKGHLGTIKKIVDSGEVASLLIGIGSCEQFHTAYNPFTAQEREEMIRASLKLNIPYEIKLIPDNPDNDIWTKDLLAKYFKGDLVYSGNSLVQELLTAAGLEVRIPPPIENPSGTQIREMMRKGEKWEDFVPKGTLQMLYKIRGQDRVKRILVNAF
jgi:nicotinamide-nucleotide adenylyltransferase